MRSGREKDCSELFEDFCKGTKVKSTELSLSSMRPFLNFFTFLQYDWLWKSEKDVEYKKFASGNPSLDDYEAQLRRFSKIQTESDSVSSIHIIGALSLNTKHLKLHLGKECDNWKFKVR